MVQQVGNKKIREQGNYPLLSDNDFKEEDKDDRNKEKIKL